MRVLRAYLAVYFALIIGAGLALWQSGAASRVPASWLVLAALVVLGLGLLLALVARPAAARD